jgi:hypothetical protein
MFQVSLTSRLDHLEAERTRLQGELETLRTPEPVSIHPGLAEIYGRKVAHLVSALNCDGTREEAAAILRGLIERIAVRPDPEARDGHCIEVFGELGAILRLGGEWMGRNADARSDAAGVRQVTVVAGAGFEPAAFRL